jgi:hypothetical protein
VGQPNERNRDARRVDHWHDIQADSGEWVRVRAAGTLHFRSGGRVRVFHFIDGRHDRVQLSDEMMSRVAEGAR